MDVYSSLRLMLPDCSYPGVATQSLVRLAYGQRPDGSIAHISQVLSGLGCGCTCPGCGADLIARKGDVNEHHFGHQSTAECAHALESALHKLAKEVLHDRRQILLPEVGADQDGRTLITHSARIYQFDDAVLEQSMGAIVPDVVVRKGGHRLLVEIFVTHRCDHEKIALVRETGLSCVEIDLSRMSRRATRDEIAKALIADAPRYWINNPKIEQAEARLRIQLEEERVTAKRAAEAARAKNERRWDRLAQNIVKRGVGPLRHRTPAPRTIETMRKVESLGFANLIGHRLNGDDCFACTPDEWQSSAIERFIIAPLEGQAAGYFYFFAANVLKHLRSAGLLAADVVHFVSKEDEAALLARVPNYLPPLRVVEAFLTRLETNNVLVKIGYRWTIARDAECDWNEKRAHMRALARRRDDLRLKVAQLLRSATDAEKADFDLERWWEAPHPTIDISFAEAFAVDDNRITALSFVIYQLEALLFRSGEIIDDLFGLPLNGAIEREIEARREKAAIEAGEAKALARQQGAERVFKLEQEARLALGREASPWLDKVDAILGEAPRAAAAASLEKFDQARYALRRHVRDLERLRDLEQLRLRILMEASQMRRPDHARVFLTTPNPAWRGRHPIDTCVDEKSFNDLKKRMAKVAS